MKSINLFHVPCQLIKSGDARRLSREILGEMEGK